MKSIVALPFVGPLIEKVFGVETKPAPAQNDGDLLNGTVWQAPWLDCRKFIVLYGAEKDGDWLYNLIATPYQRYGREKLKGTASMICHLDSHDNYSGLYTEEQLRKKLSKWKYRPELELRLWNRDTEELNWI